MMKNILIVEDNEVHMKALVKILSSIEDIQIFKAYNKAEANYMLSLNTYNVFLIDIILDTKKPGDVSGIDFVNKLRGYKEYQFTPVIFITSLEDPKLCAYRDLHCYQYIEKPFVSVQVEKTVREALKFPINKVNKENAYFRKDGILFSVKIDTITHIVVGRNGVKIYTDNDCLQLGYQPVTEILKELESDEFVQCSRGTIINKKHIEYIDYSNRYVKLRGVKDTLEIGPIMKKHLRDGLKDNG
ncbi:MAG: response regulator [Lachnospiraceae bacterium]|nr:response regulator [Lachnospiraceae bacterium]